MDFSDIPRRHRRRRTHEVLTHTITISVTANEHAAFIACAEEQGMTMAAVGRRAINAAVLEWRSRKDSNLQPPVS